LRILSDSEITFYFTAKKHLSEAGFSIEIDGQTKQPFQDFSESDLLRQMAWVILCSGFRESVVRQYFSFISLCFCDWQSAALICSSAVQCKSTAMSVFRYEKKIDALVKSANLINDIGFVQFKGRILDEPINVLQVFPFIGPVTAFHLAKNLGFPTAKPDRHLQRMAEIMGYSDAHHLCSVLSEATGDPIQVVDIVLWRCAEQKLALFSDGNPGVDGRLPDFLSTLATSASESPCGERFS
jgi:hypothetical protein